jgi:hypothetical protein
LPASPDEQLASDEESEELPARGEFESLVKRGDRGPTVNRGGKPAPFTFAPLGQKTLSLILEACIKMRAKKTAVEYWSLLTSKDSYGVKPDENNFSTYLRLLRVMRSSDEALRTVQFDMPEAGITPAGKEYFLAMSVCARDKLNPNSFGNATTILDLMQTNLTTLDIATTSLYLDLASWSGDSGRILTAVDRVWDSNIIRRTAFEPGRGGRGRASAEAVVALTRRMVGCYDRLRTVGREVGGREWKELARRKGVCAAVAARVRAGKVKRTRVDDGGGTSSSPSEDRQGYPVRFSKKSPAATDGEFI